MEQGVKPPDAGAQNEGNKMLEDAAEKAKKGRGTTGAAK
jgi:hypothetical protein